MLIQFNFSNYKSYKDEVSLDLSATKTTEYSDRVVTLGKERILRAAGIFGANASGKSNVYEAFDYMTDYVLTSMRFNDSDSKNGDENVYSMPPVPFLFDDESAKKESSFEVFFTVPNDVTEKVYNYGFCVNQSGVTEEWLHRRSKTQTEFRNIFYRDNDNIEFHTFTKLEEKMLRKGITKKVLLSSLGAQLNITICKLVRDWFYNNECTDFASLFTAFKMSHSYPAGFVDNKVVQNDVIHFLSTFDKHIQGFEIEETPSEDEKDNSRKQYFIGTKHKIINSDEYGMIPLEWESAGTLKMFSLYSCIQNVLKNGGVFFVDELNARLHPLLVRNIILSFLNPRINVNNAQIIFTSHDTWQLSNQLLRRDEIWFTEKNTDGISKLYSLADFVDEDGTKIRKDENYEKNYLLGKYGAIPELSEINLVGGKE